MDRCGVQYRARSSFEKAHGEAPPRLQVIGFTVCAPKADTKEGLGIMSAPASPPPPNENDLLSFESKPSPSLPKPASSPRSALQQLLLNQSLSSTSSPSANHSLPLGSLPLPPSPSSSSSGRLTPGSSSPSTNDQTSTSGLLQLQRAISPPAANQNWTNGVSKPRGQSPSAYGSSGRLESLLQSENASSDVPAKQRSRTSFFSSPGQSQCASSSSSGNQRPIKKNYDALFGSKGTDDEACYEEKKKFKDGNDAKTHEIKGRMISAQDAINELPHVEKRNKSSSLHYDEYPCAEECQKSSWKGLQKINERPLGNEKSRKSSWNEEKAKKSSLFMFVVSSPAPEFHDHLNHGEYNMSKDMDFLSSCHLCRRRLGHDEDVFMYSGYKAFCSMECRYQQIVIDERKERCPPPIIRSGASQVYQHTSITTTATTHHPIMINKPHFINTAAAA